MVEWADIDFLLDSRPEHRDPGICCIRRFSKANYSVLKHQSVTGLNNDLSLIHI